MVLGSPHDHIEITESLAEQLRMHFCHTESERRGRHRTGWFHTPVWQLKVRKAISAAEVPLRREGSPTSPQPRFPVQGREVPRTPGCKNQQEWWLADTKGCCSPRSCS